MKNFLMIVALASGMAMVVQQASAQSVPYGVTGSGAGNLATGEAEGTGVGLHFGKLDFAIDSNGLDVQTAADGSELWLEKGNVLLLEFIPAGNGLVVVLLIDEWNIVGGTGRFANATAAGGPIISTAYTEPFDLSNPVGSFVFQKHGRINLGRAGN